MFPALWLQLGEKAVSWAQVCCYLGAGTAGLLPSPLMGALLAPGDPPAGPAQAAGVQCPAAPPVPGKCQMPIRDLGEQAVKTVPAFKGAIWLDARKV